MNQAKGLLDESGYPRVAASFGGGGTPQFYMGSFPAFLAAWGPVDMGFGSGQGVKCYHSEHLYGELWHRGFTVSPDTPLTNYLISCGANVEASGGGRLAPRERAQPRHEARAGRAAPVGHRRLLRRVGADQTEDRCRVPLRLIHVAARGAAQPLDLEFLYRHTSRRISSARTATTCAIRCTGSRSSPARSKRRRRTWRSRSARTAMCSPKAGSKARPSPSSRAHEAVPPEWAQAICDVPAATIRRIAREYLQAARVGETIEIEKTAAVSAGRGEPRQNRHQRLGRLRVLLGAHAARVARRALEVPGGILGTTVRLNRPMSERHRSVKAGPTG